MFNVLVVDDDKNTRSLMQAVLGKDYNVFTAENGNAALRIMDEQYVDLVVVDIMMPELDGYGFTSALRESDSEIPILMVSAKQLPADRKEGFRVGIDDFMTKPVDNEELLLHVKALLRRARIVSEHRITVGDAVLDYDSFTVSREGESIELPQKNSFCFISFFPTPTRSSRVYSSWTKSGA